MCIPFLLISFRSPSPFPVLKPGTEINHSTIRNRVTRMGRGQHRDDSGSWRYGRLRGSNRRGSDRLQRFPNVNDGSTTRLRDLGSQHVLHVLNGGFNRMEAANFLQCRFSCQDRQFRRETRTRIVVDELGSEYRSDGGLSFPRSPFLESPFEPIRVRHSRTGIRNSLHPGRNRNNLLDRAAQALLVVVPVDDLTEVRAVDVRVLQPLPQEEVSHRGVGAEYAHRDGALRHRGVGRILGDDQIAV